jgi:nucleoside diphosphate kinase
MLDDPVAWQHQIFVMVSPDCLTRGLTRTVLDRLAGIGLRPLGWRFARITSHRIDRMSELQQLTAAGVYRYRTLDALFALGPALMVTLRDEQGRSADEFYAAAKALKGDADPTRAQPGSIRHDLGAMNTVLNLLHISDSPDAAATECTTLAGSDPALFQSTGLGELLDLLESRRPETRGFTDVLSALRAQLLAAVWGDISASARARVTRLTRDGALGDPTTGKALADALRGQGVRPAETVEVLGWGFDGTLPRADMDCVARVFAGHGLDLDPWERVVLTTSAVFPPDTSALR